MYVTKQHVTRRHFFHIFTYKATYDILQEAQLMLTTGSTRLAVNQGQQT